MDTSAKAESRRPEELEVVVVENTELKDRDTIIEDVPGQFDLGSACSIGRCSSQAPVVSDSVRPEYGPPESTTAVLFDV